jgi:hypothetical protein
VSASTRREKRDYAAISQGSWFIRDKYTVVFVAPGCIEAAYQKKTLKIAIATVKANRASYATQEAYDAMLRHFERGLGLFS